MPREMICAIARYESTLRGDEPPADSVPTTVATTTTTTTAPPGADEAAEEESSPPEPAFCSDEALEALDQ